jgi:hypothetical protein
MSSALRGVAGKGTAAGLTGLRGSARDHVVIRGLDPRIQKPAEPERAVGCRVKHGNDIFQDAEPLRSKPGSSDQAPA